MVQVEFAAMVPPPPPSVTKLEPAGAVGNPPQVLVKPFGVAIINPAGNVSVNATPFNAVVVFGLVIVKVRVDAALTPIDANGGLKALEIDGALIDVPVTVRLAVAGPT